MQNSLDSLLVPVVQAAKLQAIPYADSIDGPIQYLTPEEFKQKFNCTYLEGLHINYNQLPKYLNSLENHLEGMRITCDALAIASLLSPKDLQVSVRERLNHPLISTAIRKFNTATGIGYGLFATALIPKGTVIIYSGEFLEKNEQNKYRLLSHGAIAERGKVDYYAFNCTTTHSISARDAGGIARFINHMPFYSTKDLARNVKLQFLDLTYIKNLLLYVERYSKYSHHAEQPAGFYIHEKAAKDLQDYYKALSSSQNETQTYLHFATKLSVIEKFIVDQYRLTQSSESEEPDELSKLLFFNDSDKRKVCTANLVKATYVDENGCMFWILIAKYDIAANEQLGFSYRIDNFTAAGEYPRYFMNGGRELIPRTTYLIDDSVNIPIFNTVVNLSNGSKQQQVLSSTIETLEKTIFIHHCILLDVKNQTLSNVKSVSLSTYSIRDQLCNSEILPSEYYGKLSYTIGAVAFLRNFFPNIDIQTYYANPREQEMAKHENNATLDSYKVNIVCRTTNTTQFNSMFSFFNASNRPHCQKKMEPNRPIGQIVLTDVNEVDQHSGLNPLLAELSNSAM